MHSSYPQDKGEVGRSSRTSTGSSSITVGEFPEWLKGTLDEYKVWFNHSRFTGE